MPVLEFECQLARSQISRYMGGEVLSEDLLRHLGAHVADCPGCRDFLEQRRAALKVMLGTDAALTAAETQPSTAKKNASGASRLTHAVVQVEEETPLSPREVLMNRLRGQASVLGIGSPAAESPAEAPAAPKKISARQFGKPALYSVGLAAVLVAMSWMVKSPNGFLGPKALGSSISASSNPSPEANKPVASQATSKTAPAAAKLTPPKNQAQADAILQAEATNKPVPTTSKNTASEPKKDLESAVAAPTTATAVKTPVKPVAKTKKKAVAHKSTVRHSASHRTTRRTRSAVKHTAKKASSQVSIKVYNP